MTRGEDPEAVFLAELGHRVRNMRALRGMSRKVLSKASGLSERYIAQLESGGGNVSIILPRRVSTAIGSKLEDLIPSTERAPDWPVIRDLLRGASKEQISQIKEICRTRRRWLGPQACSVSSSSAFVAPASPRSAESSPNDSSVLSTPVLERVDNCSKRDERKRSEVSL
jgi:transcriptional regulator with XRE-family HTH domain